MKKKIERPQTMGGYCTDSEFQKMSYDEFRDYCGGRLAVALFKGEFNQELFQVIQFANARGMLRQWEITNGID